MDCETCNNLLAAYKHATTLLRDAVSKSSGAIGDDSRLAVKEAARSSEECKQASNALMEHWRQAHGP